MFVSFSSVEPLEQSTSSCCSLLYMLVPQALIELSYTLGIVGDSKSSSISSGGSGVMLLASPISGGCLELAFLPSFVTSRDKLGLKVSICPCLESKLAGLTSLGF